MLLLILAAAAASASVPEVILIPGPAKSMPVINPNAAAPPTCPPPTAYEAARRGGKLRPHNLTDLPPATTYMAVFRHIGGCEAPLTMADYRNERRR